MLLRIRQSRHRSRHRDRLVAQRAHVLDHVAVLVEIHVGGGLRRRLLAVIEEVHLAIRTAKEHEASASDIACLGMGDGQRESDRDGGIHRIAARLHDLDAGIGRVALHRGHHGLGSVRRLHHGASQRRCARGQKSARVLGNAESFSF